MKKIMVIVSSVIASVIVIMCLFLGTKTSRALNKYLNSGDKYLEETEFQNAIAMYKKAVSIDKKNEEAYLGLVQASIGMENDSAALDFAKSGYEATGYEHFADWIDLLEKNTQEELAQKEDTIYISKLIYCPTICGMPWNEAGDVQGMRSIMPEMASQDVSQSEVEGYLECNTYDEVYFSYATHMMMAYVSILMEDTEDAFNYIEYDNGEKWLTVTHESGVETTEYFDGFYNLLLNNNNDIDEVLNSLGIDTEEIKRNGQVQCDSDRGTIVVSFESEILNLIDGIKANRSLYVIETENDGEISIFEDVTEDKVIYTLEILQ